MTTGIIDAQEIGINILHKPCQESSLRDQNKKKTTEI